MKLLLTGGGTGGHIYPAMVVGEFAADKGAELLYYGSERGQEGRACQERSIPFTAFPSEPLKGLMSLLKMQQCRAAARAAMKLARPDVVFSTGGYSAGPVVAAARDLRIPYVIHSVDSIPAKSSRMFAKEAAAFSCVFHKTVEVVTERQVVRTGQPIRREFRSIAKSRLEGDPVVLVIGGSQGASHLNETMPEAATGCAPSVRFLHISGPDHLQATKDKVEKLGLTKRYSVVPILGIQDMLGAYLRSTLAVSRSGGTLAELALFEIPSVLVPLPWAASDHQMVNAQEFEAMRAATLLTQSVATPARLSSAVTSWLNDTDRRIQAQIALKSWDVPDATERIYRLIEGALR